MAFVYERVPDEGKEYLKKFNLIDLSQDIPLDPLYWTVDKENNYILVGLLASTSYDRPWKFAFIYEEKHIGITAHKQSESGFVTWRIDGISIPANLKVKEKEILRLIPLALMERTSGPYNTYKSKVTISYNCTPYYYEEK